MAIKSAIASLNTEDDEIIAEGLNLLIRKHLSQAMRVCTRNDDPSAIEHYMDQAKRVMHLRRQING